MSAATDARDEAIGRATRHSPQEWIHDARLCVRALAVVRLSFSSDDVWQTIGQPPEPRALGGVMVDMSSNGWVKPTNLFVPSARPERHAGPVRLWVAGSEPPPRGHFTPDEAVTVLDRLHAKYQEQQ